MLGFSSNLNWSQSWHSSQNSFPSVASGKTTEACNYEKSWFLCIFLWFLSISLGFLVFQPLRKHKGNTKKSKEIHHNSRIFVVASFRCFSAGYTFGKSANPDFSSNLKRIRAFFSEFGPYNQKLFRSQELKLLPGLFSLQRELTTGRTSRINNSPAHNSHTLSQGPYTHRMPANATSWTSR